jgi:hypothetical protein
VYAVGDQHGFRRPLWLDLSKPNTGQRLHRFAIDQGGARVSVSSYRDRSSRAARNVERCRWVMVDQDGKRRAIPDAIPPSIIVYSGSRTGSHRHRHLLWRVDDLDRREVGQFNRDQGELVGGDPNFTAGATATVRVPLDAEDVTLTDRTYRALDLRRHHPPARSCENFTIDTAPGEVAEFAITSTVDGALAKVAQGASRNLTGWELAGELCELGLSEADAMRAGERYQVTVENAKPNDYPYSPGEWRGQIERRFANGPRKLDAAHVATVDRWESGWLGDASLSSSQKTAISAVAGIVRATGKVRFTLSERELSERSRLSRPAVSRALKGTKARDGLIGKALRADGRWRKGRKGAKRFELIPNLPLHPLDTSLFSPLSGNDWTHPQISSTIPPNHDAWSHLGIGHGARLVFDVLASFEGGAAASDLARSPVLSSYPSTIRKQLNRLASHGLAERLPDGRWVACIDSLTATLDAAAEATGAEGYGERLHRRHQAERIAYAKATDPAERLRRRLHRCRAGRLRRIERTRLNPQERRWSWTQSPAAISTLSTRCRRRSVKRSWTAKLAGGVPVERFGRVAVAAALP